MAGSTPAGRLQRPIRRAGLVDNASGDRLPSQVVLQGSSLLSAAADPVGGSRSSSLVSSVCPLPPGLRPQNSSASCMPVLGEGPNPCRSTELDGPRAMRPGNSEQRGVQAISGARTSDDHRRLPASTWPRPAPRPVIMYLAPISGSTYFRTYFRQAFATCP